MSLEVSPFWQTLPWDCQCWPAQCSAFCITGQRWQKRRRPAMICSAQSCCKGNRAKIKCVPLIVAKCVVLHVRITTYSSSISSWVTAELLAAETSTFFFPLGVSGRWKQMVPSLLPSRPVLHLCHSLLRRIGSSLTQLMCSSHLQALCQGPTLTCPEFAFLRASCLGYEKCPEGLDHNSAQA